MFVREDVYVCVYVFALQCVVLYKRERREWLRMLADSNSFLIGCG